VTITDRRATTDTRRGIAAGLVAARAKAGRRAKRPSLISATVTTPIPDSIDLFVAARSLGFEAALWIQPDAQRALVGIGRAWGVCRVRRLASNPAGAPACWPSGVNQSIEFA